MNTFAPGIFPPTTITMLSGMMALVATILAVTSLTQDQSGQSAALLSQSFRAEIGAEADKFELIAIARKDSPSFNNAPPLMPLTLDLTFGQRKDHFDPASEFAMLLSELSRFAGNCVAGPPVREVQIDVLETNSEIVTSAMEQISSSLRDAELSSVQGGLQVELQTWAASPTQTAWVNAVRDADRLREEMDLHLSMSGTRQYETTSSASLWPHADRVRPALTIVLRFP